jgi:hypothetical protein
MYTNIPKNEVINIIKDILENNKEIGTNTQKEIIHIIRTILEQNCFQVEQEYYKQSNGLAMGAPKSSILAEIYATYRTHTNIPHTNTATNNCILQIRRRYIDSI